MGMFKVRIRVGNPAEPARFFEDDFWVDTGALYSFVPEDRLKEIGLAPRYTRELIMADGRRTQRPFGEARFTISELGETMTCPIIFAPPGALYLLGATALETFGVDADPIEKKLKPISAIIGGLLASTLTS
jgi:predicted aspartyl protease